MENCGKLGQLRKEGGCVRSLFYGRLEECHEIAPFIALHTEGLSIRSASEEQPKPATTYHILLLLFMLNSVA